MYSLILSVLYEKVQQKRRINNVKGLKKTSLVLPEPDIEGIEDKL